MFQWRAITRGISPRIVDCALTHLERSPINIAAAETQHAAYEALLERLGCELVRLPALADMPDCVFVEDTAVVVDEVAVITRPGVASRQGEVESMAAALAPYRRLERIGEPGTLDGGDVLRVGRRFFVGIGGRTNRAGFDAFAGIVGRHGYEAVPVRLSGCLHLKTAVTEVGEELLLVNRAWLADAPFTDYQLIDVAASEPNAANALRLGDTVIYPDSNPRTAALLEKQSVRLSLVQITELAKAEAGVTCCSLILSH